MPSPGDQICSHGVINPGIDASLVIDLAGLAIPGLDVPDAFIVIFNLLGIVALDVTGFCTNPPRYPGDPDFGDVIQVTAGQNVQSILDKYKQLAFYSMWPFLCSCTTYVAPNVSYAPPPAWPVGTPSQNIQTNPAALTCSFVDVYNKLDGIRNLLQLVLATIGPHSYSYGSTYTVSGTGEIAVSGIIGVLTHPLTYTPGYGLIPSDPTRLFNVGWISFGDANGWFTHNRIIMDPQFHYGAPTGTTRVGYDCEMVSSMNILTLLPAVLYQGN